MNKQPQALFQAYYNARKNKRSSLAALAFEIDYETNLFKLYDEIINNRYLINPGICFISFHPVKREIFAADFRDRIVHHLIYNYINPSFEKVFINDSYSCRVGKGTSYGIKRCNHFIRSCSSNYHHDCYILKLDIKGYFMSIHRPLLYQKVEKTIHRYQNEINCDYNLLLPLVRQIIFHDPTKNCVIKGDRNNWVGLPKSKSLFFAKKDCGLPIGNLTSQLFGNVYLNDFDHFIKNELMCEYYGRYVDDFIIVHQNKEYLKAIIPIIEKYLRDKLSLELHRKKIYLQHYSKGVPFLGTFIKPYRTYINNKTKGECYAHLKYWRERLNAQGNLEQEDVNRLIAGMNSYLGIMKHYNTYKLRRKIVHTLLSSGLGRFVKTNRDYTKITPAP